MNLSRRNKLNLVKAGYLACFTYFLIHFGDSYELNPFMDVALQKSFHHFLVAKLSITVVCVAILVLHKNHLLFNRISGYHLLLATFFIYVSLFISPIFFVHVCSIVFYHISLSLKK